MYPFVDFFGRVKDKAGDVERILKEKDRHGTVLCYCYLSCKSHAASVDFLSHTSKILKSLLKSFHVITFEID